MESNEDRVDKILDTMEKSNSPADFSQGLNIISKLIAK